MGEAMDLIRQPEPSQGRGLPATRPNIPSAPTPRFHFPRGRGAVWKPLRQPYLWRPDSQRKPPSSRGFNVEGNEWPQEINPSIPSISEGMRNLDLDLGPTTDSTDLNYEEQSRAFAQALGQELPPDPFDPMRNRYSKFTYGRGGQTYSINQDLEVFKKKGFIINYPKGLLGKGCFGSVYSGEYGPNVTHVMDNNGQPLRNVTPGMPFAAKLIDFSKVAENGVNSEDEIRATYEIEKKIMTFADHPNIVPIRMTLNMGEPRYYKFSGTDFVQRDRIYLIMDFAEFGPLKSYFQIIGPTVSTELLISLSQDMFWGLDYLHANRIAHGDVHQGNVLVFQGENRVVCKWSDFGLGYFATPKGEATLSIVFSIFLISLESRKRKDCLDFCNNILEPMWTARRHHEENPNTQVVANRFIEFMDELRNEKDLETVLPIYTAILNWNR